MSADGDGSAGSFDVALSLARMGLIVQSETFDTENLSGGVSCEVWLIAKANGDRLVLKHALPKLRVAADWCAPAERSHTEVEWLRLVAAIDPKLVPGILGEDRAAHAFALKFLPPDRFPLWKAQLATGHADPQFAARTGAALVDRQGEAAPLALPPLTALRSTD